MTAEQAVGGYLAPLGTSTAAFLLLFTGSIPMLILIHGRGSRSRHIASTIVTEALARSRGYDVARRSRSFDMPPRSGSRRCRD